MKKVNEDTHIGISLKDLTNLRHRSDSDKEYRERRRERKYKRKNSNSKSSNNRRGRSGSREEGSINGTNQGSSSNAFDNCVKNDTYYTYLDNAKRDKFNKGSGDNDKEKVDLINQASFLTDEAGHEIIIDEEEKLEREAEERRKRIEAIMAKHKTNSNPRDTNSESEQPAENIANEEEKQGMSSASSENNIAKMEETKEQLLRTLDEERERLNAMITSELKIEEEQQQKSLASIDMFDVDSEEEDQGNYIEEAIKRGFKVVNQDINVDSEGYYQPKVGEIINPTTSMNFDDENKPAKPAQYKIIGIAGKGVFSSVVKAENINLPEDDPHRLVGIKMMRMRDIMVQSGLKERELLKDLNNDDAEDKRFIIRMLNSFEYRKHLCIVFEYLHYNLREVLKKFGKSIGLSLEGVRMYTKQLFIALQYLRKHEIIHADLKPDNILVTEDLAKVKLCDFGTAFLVDERKITEYLASGYYRAPEVMIGCQYDTQIDVWAAAVSLYELYTGDVMFPGKSNTHMLKLIMELKGRINSKMLKKGEFTDKHFDDKYLRSVPINPEKSLSDILGRKKSKGDDIELLNKFVDFLEK